MNTELMKNMAADNMLELSSNPYPGRGIIVGTSEDGKFAVQIYWIMGRSDNSRNRVFSTEDGRLFTEAADPDKVKDPKLIIYNAMAEYCGNYVVSNGDQTDTVIDALMLDSNEANRVSIAVKFIEIATGRSRIEVINKYTKVAPAEQ